MDVASRKPTGDRFSSFEKPAAPPPLLDPNCLETTCNTSETSKQPDTDEFFTFTNWSGTNRMAAKQLVLIQDVKSLQSTLAQASEEGTCVRLRGAGHSFNAQTDCDGTGRSLNVHNLNKLVSVDLEKNIVVVQAGMRLQQLYEHLNKHGMALPNIGIIYDTTVAGCISTGTHGSGWDTCSMSSNVIGMRILDTKGVLRSVGELAPNGSRHSEDMNGLRVGLGLCGIIVEVMLQCIPVYQLTHTPFITSFEVACAKGSIVNLARKHPYFKAWWYPGTDMLYTYLIDVNDPETETRATDLPSDLPELDPVSTFGASVVKKNGQPVKSAPLEFKGGVPSPEYRALSPIAKTNLTCLLGMTTETHTNNWDWILTNSWEASETGGVKFDACEYAVDVEVCHKVLDEMGKLVRSGQIELDCPVDIRVGAPEDTWLGLSQGKRVCYIGFCGKKSSANADEDLTFSRTIDLLDSLMNHYGARMHWGKVASPMWNSPGEIQAKYPAWPKFRELMKQYDPNGVLINKFWRQFIQFADFAPPLSKL